MFEAGIIDPAKVARVAVENAASIAGMILTTEAAITEIPEDEKCLLCQLILEWVEWVEWVEWAE